MGEDYPIKSDADEEYLRELAAFVEDRIMAVSTGNTLPSRLKREVVAAILIADEYFSEKLKNADIEKRLAELTATVKEALKKDLIADS